MAIAPCWVQVAPCFANDPLLLPDPAREIARLQGQLERAAAEIATLRATLLAVSTMPTVVCEECGEAKLLTEMALVGCCHACMVSATSCGVIA